MRVSVVDQTTVDSNNAFEANNLFMAKRKRSCKWRESTKMEWESGNSWESKPPGKLRTPPPPLPPPPPPRPPPSWKEQGSAAPPAKNYSSDNHLFGSAARPGTKPVDRSAERPAHRVSQWEKRVAVGKKPLTSVAYLKLPAFTEKVITQDAARRCVVGVVRKAKEAGADVINIVFQRAADIDFMDKELHAEMQATSKHPGYKYRRVHQLLTLFSPDCGNVVGEDTTGFEDGVPVICLTLSGPHENCGPMIIINAAAEQLRQPSRERRTTGTCNVFHPWVPCDRGEVCFWVRWEKVQVRGIVSGWVPWCNAQGSMTKAGAMCRPNKSYK